MPGGWSRVRGGRSDRDARRARVPSRGTESQRAMTRPTVGTARAGQLSLHLGVSQPDPRGGVLSTCWPGTVCLCRDKAPRPCSGAPWAVAPPAQPARALCAGSDRHTWCSH